MYPERCSHLPSLGRRTCQSLARWRLHPSDDVSFASPRYNAARLWWVGNEEALVHLASQYPWLIFRGDVCARRLGFGFGYNHGGEVPVLFYDALGPSHTEHRHLLSIVVELPYVLDPSVESFLDVIIVEYPRYP